MLVLFNQYQVQHQLNQRLRISFNFGTSHVQLETLHFELYIRKPQFGNLRCCAKSYRRAGNINGANAVVQETGQQVRGIARGATAFRTNHRGLAR
jgi:hypothetical protein